MAQELDEHLFPLTAKQQLLAMHCMAKWLLARSPEAKQVND